jgi:hypothetical protein
MGFTSTTGFDLMEISDTRAFSLARIQEPSDFPAR